MVIAPERSGTTEELQADILPKTPQDEALSARKANRSSRCNMQHQRRMPHVPHVQRGSYTRASYAVWNICSVDHMRWHDAPQRSFDLHGQHHMMLAWCCKSL